MNKYSQITVFGSIVTEFKVRETPGPTRQIGTKVDCRIDVGCGGGASNIGIHLKYLGFRPMGLILTGQNLDAGVDLHLKSRLPGARRLPVLKYGRMSVLLPDDRCYSERSAATITEVPQECRHIFKTAAWTVIAPFLAADAPLIRSVMSCSNRTVLMPSAEFLSHPQSYELLSRAHAVVMNDAELTIATSETDCYEGIRTLRERGVRRRIIVTSPHSCLAYDSRHGFIFEQAFEVDSTRQTIGAGDVFTACLVARLASGGDLRSAIRCGLAGAADHVEARLPARSLKELQRRIPQRQRQPFHPPRATQSKTQAAMKWVAAALLLIVPTLWGTL